jgi:signal transduction histidine kinase
VTHDVPGARGNDDRLDMLIEAGLALASELDLETVLGRIVEVAASITGARYGALGVLGEDAPRIERFITRGVSDEQRAAIGHPPVGHGILGLLIREQRPLRLPEIGLDPRSVGFPEHHPPMHSFLGAPVKAAGRVFGNIYLTEKQGAHEFDEADEAALVVLAVQAGVAIENARLYEETRRVQDELARLELLDERERIAKDLHDGVIQSLFAVGMGLQGTAAMAGDEDIARRIEHATEEIDRAIRDLRNYIFGLRPGVLADRQLDQAVRQLAREFEERSGVLTIIDVDTAVAAELASVASEVVQIVRESLSNVSRHAEATSCRITLRRTERGAELEIDDDGLGFDPSTAQRGMGMDNLDGRVLALGGDLTVESVLGEGATITVSLPL